MEFNAENVVKRTVALRKEFGSAAKLAEAAGVKRATVYNYCNLERLHKHHPKKETWEKIFGQWDVDSDKIEEDTQEQKNDTVENKPAFFPMEKKGGPKLTIEADDLEELVTTLKTFGFRLEFVPR